MEEPTCSFCLTVLAKQVLLGQTSYVHVIRQKNLWTAVVLSTLLRYLYDSRKQNCLLEVCCIVENGLAEQDIAR